MKKIGITECKIMKDEEIDDNRYLDCADYDDCLSEAVRQNMYSFHCKNCHAFQEYLAAKDEDLKYELCLLEKKIMVQRFKPGFIHMHEKNFGTLWND